MNEARLRKLKDAAITTIILALLAISPAHANEFKPGTPEQITIRATVYSEADFMSLEECIRTTDRNKSAECAEIVEGIEPGAGERVQPETTINPAPSGSGEKEK
jgi:hypothetical protein